MIWYSCTLKTFSTSFNAPTVVMLKIQMFSGIMLCKGKGKGKAIPLQAWTGPEGSRRLRFPHLKTIGI